MGQKVYSRHSLVPTLALLLSGGPSLTHWLHEICWTTRLTRGPEVQVCEQVWVSAKHIVVAEAVLGDEDQSHSQLEAVVNSDGSHEDRSSVHGLSVELGDVAVAGRSRVEEGAAGTTAGIRQKVVVHQRQNWEMAVVAVKGDSSMLDGCLEKVCALPAAAQPALVLP
jgi:hypothetical protein